MIFPDEKTTFQRISKNILAGQREIDELAVQLALGKAEARDKFEEIKKEFRERVSELEQLIESTSGKLLNPVLRARLEHLELQLSLGKADTRELFDVQKKKILTALDAMEEEIKLQLRKIRVPDYFSHEAEKLKLKLEVLRLRYDLKKFEVKDVFKVRMEEARREIERITDGVRVRMGQGRTRYHDFKDEISLAYKHIRKAVESL